MKKVGLLFHNVYTDDLFDQLFSLGMVEIVPFEPQKLEEKPSSALEDKINELRSILNYIDSFGVEEKEKESEGVAVVQGCPFLLEDRGERVADEIRKERKILEQIDSDLRKVEGELRNYIPWSAVEVPVERFRETETTIMELGTIPQSMFKTFLALFENEPLFAYDKVKEESGTVYLFIVYHKSIADKVKENLSKCDYSPFELDLKGRIADKIRALEDEVSLLKARRGRIVERVKELASKEKKTLELLHSWYAYLRDKQEAVRMGKEVGPTRFLQGWVMEKDYEKFKKEVEQRFDAVSIFELEPEKDEVPPVALENPEPVKPIEIITKLYGLPRKGMLDPTPIIAPFYTTYFAFCLSDAGYGAILALIAFVMLKKMKDEGIRNIARFLLMMGISSIIVGAIMGGYFGADLESSSSPIARFLLRFKLLDPLKDALTFFAITILFGMFQVALGFLLRGYIQFKEGVKLPLKIKAIVIAISWALMVLSGGVFMCFFLKPQVFGHFTGLARQGLLTGACGIFFGSLIFGLLSGKNLFASIWDGIGFDGLYGFISVMGDLLSYSRILALGLSTGVIAGVINIVARQIKGIPLLGFLIFIVVLAVGHIGLTAISTLGSFVHPARLQFVEFFTKFYESGGKPFKPLEAKLPLKKAR